MKMKTNLIIALCLVLAAFSACTRTSTTNENINLSPEGVKKIVQEGSWRISYFHDSVNLTYDFSGYWFTFLANGTVDAIKNGNTVTGYWSTAYGGNAVGITMQYNTGGLFDILTGNWMIVTANSGEIRISRVNAGKSYISYLTFVKN